jgi:hypothetical protein
MKTIVLLSLFSLALTAAARAQDALPPGTRVGVNAPRGAVAPATYDHGGRRDPFASLIPAPRPLTAPPHARLQLSSLGTADVSVKGVLRNGAVVAAILESVEGRWFVAHRGDRLHDAIVGKIDQDGVVFVAQLVDAFGVARPHDVRKTLRPFFGEAR